MKPLQPIAARRNMLNTDTYSRFSRRVARAALPTLLMVFACMLFAVPGSSGATSGVVPKADAHATSDSAAVASGGSVTQLVAAPFSHKFWLPTLMPFLGPETVTVYESNCTTPKSVPVEAALGDQICIKVTNAPFGGPSVLRRLVVANPLNFVAAQTDITSGAQTALFTFPTNPTTGGLDNRGPWTIGTVDPNDASLVRSVIVHVHDPAQTVADLTISKIQLGTGSVAGTDVTFQLYIWNRGPDSATNVHFSDNTLPNTTFVSLTQNSGPTFNCTTPTVGSPGTSTCTRGTTMAPLTFNRGDVASFTAVYHVNTSVGNGADLTDTATVASDTFDQSSSSNSSNVTTSASNPTPPNCTITCPNNITQDNDPNQAGAIINFDNPATAGTCGALTIDHASGSFFPIGSTVVTANVADGTANGVSCSFTVMVNDNRVVSISLNGASEMTVECRTGFSDPGATATSAGNPVPVITTVTKPSGQVDGNGDPINPITVPAVDPSTPADYTITYSATTGSSTSTVTRVVHVVDTTPPVITLAGTQGLTEETVQVTVTNEDGTTSTITEKILVGTVECHTSFTPPTATAFDGCDNQSVPVTASGAVNTNTPGDYEIVYAATDAAGNDTERRVRVHVVDTTAPTITLNGSDPMTVECHTQFNDPGATATDGCEGPVAVTVSGTVDANTPGTYTITYAATDTHNNPATKTRTVVVSDTTAPDITLNGANSIIVECHTSFTDPGATATDGCEGPVAVNVSGSVDVNHAGDYTLTYNATDASGNHAVAVTRTVHVTDTIPPVITRNGASDITVECHTAFTDPGATASDGCDANVAVTVSGSVNVNLVGNYTLTYNATDASGNHAAPVTRIVHVVDTTAPTITLNGQTPSMWPANHEYQTFLVTNFVTGAGDGCNTTLGISSVVIEKVTSDELENGDGDGNTLNDIVIAADCKSVQLRSERDGGGDGRVYTITFRLRDASGNTTRATARVVVPHNNGGTAVDSGVHYTVTSSCP